jgi:hypothetical protein
MLEIARLDGGSDCFELDFAERESTPESALKLGIRPHLARLSLSDTVSILDRLVSNAVVRPFTTGYRKLIYSPVMAQIRVTLLLTKP